jgi:dTDP-4-dehydrorhamnose 3,5-epimerase
MSARLQLFPTPIADLVVVQRQPLSDHRGYFERMFCTHELAAAGWVKPIAQINHSYTAKQGTVRGLHFQYPPHAEMKLVSCIRGEVWDVAVDLRLGSPTFLQWHAERLSAENGCALLIPEGFAHGFQALTDDVELLYCSSAAYAVQAEGGLNPIDPRLGIRWPMVITELSTRDADHPLVNSDFKGVSV